MKSLLKVSAVILCMAMVFSSNVMSTFALEQHGYEEVIEEIADVKEEIFEETYETEENDDSESIVAEAFGDATYSLKYSVNEDGKTATVTGYEGEASGDLIIPETIDGYTVTGIGERAFYGCSGFTGDLILPDSLTDIGDNAFSSCSGFTGELILPDSLTDIGYDAFYNCSGFTGELILPDSLTDIGGDAFSNCYGFTGDLILPDSLTYIGGGAFRNCIGFTGDLIISNSVERIEERVFYNCSGFTGELILPDSLTDIGYNAFSSCSGFTGDLIIPNSVESIGELAFGYCGFTGSLTIPDSVRYIGEDAFSHTKFIRVINNSDEQLMLHDYPGTTWKNEKTGEKNIKKISQGTAVIDANIGESFVYTVNNDVESITVIGYSGVEFGDLSIPRIIDGYTVTGIGRRAFYNSGFSEKLIIPSSVTYIGENAFCYCGFTKVINDSTEPVDLAELSSAEVVWYNDDTGEFIWSIVSGTACCTQLYYSESGIEYALDKNGTARILGYTGRVFGDLVIPKTIDGYTVTGIGSGAFYYGGFSGKLIIPSSVTYIGEDAFDYRYFTKIINDSTVPVNLAEISTEVAWYNDDTGEFIWSIASGTACCTELYYSESGIEYALDKNGTAGILGYTGGVLEDLVIPKTIDGYTVTSIGERSLANCKVTGDLIIPDSVRSIGVAAFAGCSGFTGDLIIPDSVESIGELAFESCDFTGNLIIGNSVKSIGRYAFYGCSGFTGDLIIPNSVESIGEEAFGYCGFTGSLTIGNSVTYIGKDSFTKCNGFTYVVNGSNESVYLPSVEGKTWKNKETGEIITEIANGIAILSDYKPGPTPQPIEGAFKIVFAETGTEEYTVTYDGLKQEPKVYVTDALGNELIANTDYTVKYANNIKATEDIAKKATVTITGKGSYTEIKVLSFDILRKNIGDEDVVAGSMQAKKGQAVKPELVYKGTALKASDYTIDAKDKKVPADKKAGDVFEFTVNGTGNYKGTKTLEVSVVDAVTVKKLAVVQSVANFTYNAKSLNKDMLDSVSVYASTDKNKSTKLTEGTNYVLAYPENLNEENVTPAGKYTITVVGIGDYTGTVKKTINVVAPKQAKLEVNSIADKAYLPTGVTVSANEIVVKDTTNGVTLKQGVDYSVSYTNNKAVSDVAKKKYAKVNIKFIGNYAGCKAITKDFVINKAEIKDVNVYASDMIYKNAALYKAPVYVEIGKEKVAASEYSVKYYLTYDEDTSKCIEMNAKNKLELVGEETAKEVTAVVSSKNKNVEVGDIVTTFTVKKADTDLSKLKVTIYDKTTYNAKTKSYKAVTAVEYTGEEIKIEDLPDYSKINDESETSRYYVSYEIQKKNSSGKAVWEKVNKEDLSFRNINNVKVGQMTTIITSDSASFAGAKAVNIKIQPKKVK